MTAASRELWTRVDKFVWAEQLEQDSWDRAEGTGQPGRDGLDRTAGQNSWDRTAWTGQPRKDSRDRTARTGKPEQENWDRKVRKTDSQDRKQRKKARI
jgi:hypothetical protein